MPDFLLLVVPSGQMLLVKFAMNLKFLLGKLVLVQVYIGLSQTVVGINKVDIKLDCLLILRYSLRVFLLLGIQVGKLQVCLSQPRVKMDGLFSRDSA